MSKLLRMMTCAGIALLSASASLFAAEHKAREFSGIAAYYDRHYSGRTASGARYNPTLMTAAHRTLPFGTRVRVTDRKTGRSIEVVINDRGPFTRGRVIDLSLAAAKELRMIDRGLARVTALIVSKN